MTCDFLPKLEDIIRERISSRKEGSYTYSTYRKGPEAIARKVAEEAVDGGSGVGGVATSGLGGMGLTKGFASAAVALAPTGALADACSTILGNATTASGAPVEWRLAEEVDPLTDLRGQPVTYRVGSLPERVKIEAVRNGVRKVWELRRKGLLHGGIIVVGEFYALSPENITKVEDENLRRVA